MLGTVPCVPINHYKMRRLRERRNTLSPLGGTSGQLFIYALMLWIEREGGRGRKGGRREGEDLEREGESGHSN